MNVQTADSPVAVSKAVRLQPTFLRALRGVWLFTWKSQMTWRRLALSGVAMLGLPVLVYLTTTSAQTWAQNHRIRIGNPALYVNGFAKRATRAGVPLQPAQQAELSRIIAEEFSRAERESDAGGAGEPTLEAAAERQRELIANCNDRILQRVEPVLDQRQLTEFQTFQRKQRPPRVTRAGELVWGRTTPFYHCLFDLYFFIILPLNCVRMCGALIRDELEADTLSFLTTRPLSRARLLLIKFIAQTAWLQISLLAQTLLIFLAARLRGIPDLGPLLSILLGAQVLAVVAWSALGLFLGQISKRYMALALLYGSIVEMGIGRIPTNINTLSLIRHLKGMLAHNPTLQNLFSWQAVDWSKPVTALIFAAMLFLVLASLLFTFKEYHHTTEMQK